MMKCKFDAYTKKMFLNSFYGLPQIMTIKVKNPVRKWWHFWKPMYVTIVDIETNIGLMSERPAQWQSIKPEDPAKDPRTEDEPAS